MTLLMRIYSKIWFPQNLFMQNPEDSQNLFMQNPEDSQTLLAFHSFWQYCLICKFNQKYGYYQ